MNARLLIVAALLADFADHLFIFIGDGKKNGPGRAMGGYRKYMTTSLSLISKFAAA